MSKFTPLYVEAIGDSDGEESGVDYSVITDDQRHEEVFTVQDRGLAYLFAAAPDLHAACKAQIEFYENAYPEWWDIDEWDPEDPCGPPEWWFYCQRLRAALAKANGEVAS